jgi:hypothetical protein
MLDDNDTAVDWFSKSQFCGWSYVTNLGGAALGSLRFGVYCVAVYKALAQLSN